MTMQARHSSKSQQPRKRQKTSAGQHVEGPSFLQVLCCQCCALTCCKGRAAEGGACWQTVENNAALRLEVEIEHELQGLLPDQEQAVQRDSLLSLLGIGATRAGRTALW